MKKSVNVMKAVKCERTVKDTKKSVRGGGLDSERCSDFTAVDCEGVCLREGRVTRESTPLIRETTRFKNDSIIEPS